MAITFAVQGQPASPAEWTAFARRAEALGFEALSVADHPGSVAAPFVALAAAAAATTTLQVATSVVNAGAWEPLALAGEVATLDAVSGGRALLGIGAGHTPAEWTAVGRVYPNAGERVARLEEVLAAVGRLLAGERVTCEGVHIRLRDAALEWYEARALPVLVGGYGRGVLACGARHADVVELTGLGRTLPDGHRHVADWAPESVDARVAYLRAAVPAERVPPRLGALVQHVEVTAGRERAARAFCDRFSRMAPPEAVPPVHDVLGTPFALFGTEAEIAAQLERHRERWGITRYTVRADALDAVAPIVDQFEKRSA